MSKFLGIINKTYPVSEQSEEYKDIIEMIDDHFEEMNETNPAAYERFMRSVEKVAVNGVKSYSNQSNPSRMGRMTSTNSFDYNTAVNAVRGMKNEDGTSGQKISQIESNEIAKSLGLTFDKFNEYDWYYALNMIYSDFCNTPGISRAMCNGLAKSWILDKDAPAGKALAYYKAMSEYK